MTQAEIQPNAMKEVAKMQIIVRNESVEIEGYVNAVERKSKPLMSRMGQFIERICKGAFKKALERNDNVRILLNHDWNRVLGGTKEGNLELTEDNIGLHARAIISDPEVVESYNLLNNSLTQYANLKARLSQKGQSYRKGKVLVAKISIVGKAARLYLALDPNEYETSKYHHRDMSDKKSHAATPMMLRIRSKRSQKYALELIDQVAKKFDLQ